MTVERDGMITCALEEYRECSARFKPVVYWQLCCSKEHSRRRRWLKRKHRIKVALAAIEGNNEHSRNVETSTSQV